MNTEVAPVVEEKSEEDGEESRTDCVLVDLGEVSKVTQGGAWGQWDGGIGRQT